MVSHWKGFASGGNMVKSWVWEHPAGNVEDGLNRYKTGGKETINTLKNWIRVMVEGGRVTRRPVGEIFTEGNWQNWVETGCVERGVHVSEVTSVLFDSVTPWTVARQTLLSMGFSRQESWSGLLCPPPGDFSNPGIKPVSPVAPALQADYLLLNHWLSPERGESSTILNLKHECLSQQRYQLM